MKNKKKTLLIMAAGRGSRYGALKQFAELGPSKEFLFEYSIYDALKNGFDHIVLITKENYVDKLKDYLEKRIPKEIKLDVIPQVTADIPKTISEKMLREKPWGTAHAVWVAKEYISNYFIVINADDYYGNDAFKSASTFINTNNDLNLFGIVPYQLKETLSEFGTVSRGICEFVDGELKNIREMKTIGYENGSLINISTRTILNEHDLASMNFWIFNSTIFSEIEKQFIAFLEKNTLSEKEELLIPDVIQKMIEKKLIKVIPAKECTSWFGVTYAEDKSNAMNTLKELTHNKHYPNPLWKN